MSGSRVTGHGSQVRVSSDYVAAHERAIVVERGDRVQLRAHGRDPVKMIQGLITNDLENAPADRAVYGAMLTPKGRMVADLRVLRQPDGSLLLDLDAGALEATRAHLKKFVPPMFAKFDTPEPALRVLGVYGPQALALVSSQLALDPRGELAEDALVRSAEVIGVGTREAGVPGVDLFVHETRAEAVRDALVGAGAMPSSRETLDLLRLEAGRPRWGAELDPERIPLEAGLLDRAISTTKGCYTGQEVIIRILHRGHVNWQLRGLLLGDAAVPATGTELGVDAGGKTVARVTSAARSPALEQTIALAYVRREIEPGATLRTTDGATARVVALPFDTRGSDV